jgi:hypothetical protein
LFWLALFKKGTFNAFFSTHRDAIPYSLYNTLGALLIVFSLRYKWNLSAFVMEGAWFLLSIYGLYKACKMYKRKKIKK